MFANIPSSLSDIGFDPEDEGSYEDVANIITSIYGFGSSIDDIKSKLKLADDIGLSAEQLQALATVWAASYIITSRNSIESIDDIKSLSDIVDDLYSNIDDVVSKYTNKDIVLGYIAGSTLTEGEGAGTTDSSVYAEDIIIAQIMKPMYNMGDDIRNIAAICAIFNPSSRVGPLTGKPIPAIDVLDQDIVRNKILNIAVAGADDEGKKILGSKALASEIIKYLEEAKNKSIENGHPYKFNISIADVNRELTLKRAPYINKILDNIVSEANKFSSGSIVDISRYVPNGQPFDIVYYIMLSRADEKIEIYDTDIELFNKIYTLSIGQNGKILLDKVASTKDLSGVSSSELSSIMFLADAAICRDRVVRAEGYADKTISGSFINIDGENNYNAILNKWKSIEGGDKIYRPVNADSKEGKVAKNKAGTDFSSGSNVQLEEIDAGKIEDIGIGDEIEAMIGEINSYADKSSGVAGELSDKVAKFLSRVPIISIMQSSTIEGSNVSVTDSDIAEMIRSWAERNNMTRFSIEMSDKYDAGITKKEYLERFMVASESGNEIDIRTAESAMYGHVSSILSLNSTISDLRNNTTITSRISDLRKKVIDNNTKLTGKELYDIAIKYILTNTEYSAIEEDLADIADSIYKMVYRVADNGGSTLKVNDKVARKIAFNYATRLYADNMRDGASALKVKAYLHKWDDDTNNGSGGYDIIDKEPYVIQIQAYIADSTAQLFKSALDTVKSTVVTSGPWLQRHNTDSIKCAIINNDGAISTSQVGSKNDRGYVFIVRESDLKDDVLGLSKKIIYNAYGSDRASYYQTRVRFATGSGGIDKLFVIENKSSDNTTPLNVVESREARQIAIVIPAIAGDRTDSIIDKIASGDDSSSRYPYISTIKGEGNSAGLNVGKATRMRISGPIVSENYNNILSSIRNGKATLDIYKLSDERKAKLDEIANNERKMYEEWKSRRQDSIRADIITQYVSSVAGAEAESNSFKESVDLDKDIHNDAVVTAVVNAVSGVISIMINGDGSLSNREIDDITNDVVSYIFTDRKDLLKNNNFRELGEMNGLSREQLDNEQYTIRKDYADSIKEILRFNISSGKNISIRDYYRGWTTDGSYISKAMSAGSNKGPFEADDAVGGSLEASVYDIYKRGLDPVLVGDSVKEKLDAIRDALNKSGIYNGIKDEATRKKAIDACVYGRMTNSDRAALILASGARSVGDTKYSNVVASIVNMFKEKYGDSIKDSDDDRTKRMKSLLSTKKMNSDIDIYNIIIELAFSNNIISNVIDSIKRGDV